MKAMYSRDERIKVFVKERNESLFSFDETRIRAYAKKYDVKLPTTYKGFWGGVCKAICNIPDAPADVREKAEKWLFENGMSVEIN
jgi:hypothetical protein